MKVATYQEMRQIDSRAQSEYGITAFQLMQNAGTALVRIGCELFNPSRVLVVCGKGNNAGDGFAAARKFHSKGIAVDVVCLESANSYQGAAGEAFHNLENGTTTLHPPAKLTDCLTDCDLVIDALLGTGIKGQVRDAYASAIQAINESRKPVLSADVPSGIRDLDAGEQLGPAIKASGTVAFGLPKRSTLQQPGAQYAGQLITDSIDFPPELLTDLSIRLNQATRAEYVSWMPTRSPDSNKGSFGNVGVIAGSRCYAGAALLIARAALRTGCGLATIYAPEKLNCIYKVALPEAITALVPTETGYSYDQSSANEMIKMFGRHKVVAIGPGMGTDSSQRHLLEKLLAACSTPMVLDADALTLLAGGFTRLVKNRSDCILTPHPGEMSRLTNKGVAEIQMDRCGAARDLAVELGVTVLLKGASPVVARADGQVWIIPGATSALAKGGTGDVLTGVISSLIAQGLPIWKAGVLGAAVHLEAGIEAAKERGERGVLASEVADEIPLVMQRWEREPEGY